MQTLTLPIVVKRMRILIQPQEYFTIPVFCTFATLNKAKHLK